MVVRYPDRNMETMPYPNDCERHHGYTIDGSYQGHYQHFTTGINAAVIGLLVWVLAWPRYLWTPLRFAYRAPLRRVYMKTAALMLALDALIILIGWASSPGPISEAMEFLLAAVNLPVWILAGDRVPISILLLGFLTWGNLFTLGLSLFGNIAETSVDQ